MTVMMRSGRERSAAAAQVAAAARDVVAFATRAPSIHNTQPWLWQLDGQRLHLVADRSRQLAVADPEGRHLTISCGAALHHAVVAARAAGLRAEIDLLPTTSEPDRLATVQLSVGRADPETEADRALLSRRRTDRRRFTAWPLPEDRLQELVDAAALPGADAVVLRESARRVRVGLLVSKALWVESSDPRFAEEQERWTEPSPAGGVPETHRPTPHPRLGVRSRYDDPEAGATGRDAVQATDGLVVVATPGDGPADWLRTGMLLCRIWTRAIDAGLSLVPLSQVVEVPETRDALSTECEASGRHPQLLLRLGWQEIARNPLPPTGRRPVSEVLLP